MISINIKLKITFKLPASILQLEYYKCPTQDLKIAQNATLFVFWLKSFYFPTPAVLGVAGESARVSKLLKGHILV